MPKDDLKRARAEIEDLRAQINRHNHLYYVLDNPELTDAEYDALMRRLEALEAEHPELLTPDSPTQRVGAKPSEKFAVVVHRRMMISLANAMDAEEMREFDRRIKRFLQSETEIEYVAEVKLDGLAVEWYMRTASWPWVRPAATASTARSHHNIRTIKSVPLRLIDPAHAGAASCSKCGAK